MNSVPGPLHHVRWGLGGLGDARALARASARALASFGVVALASLSIAEPASAQDPWEFWPEGMLFQNLGPRARWVFDAAVARGREQATTQLDLATYLDLSFRPIRPRYRNTTDWERSRLLWMRVGYDHILKWKQGDRSEGEERAIVSVHQKLEVPFEVWLEFRERADLRWLGGEPSQRYRFRLEATREFVVRGHAIVPYAHGETMYDTRYDNWARRLYTVGTEYTMNKGLRLELFLAYQSDDLPSASDLWAPGVVVKWYR